MQKISVIGLDLAKHVFQVHGLRADGTVAVRRSLRRSEVLKFFGALPPCLVGMEACGSAHHWARELTALGHSVRLMPAHYVKPYVKRGKTDAADAEAIAEAVTRPTMRFVGIKTVDQQAALMLHKARDLLVRQRTMLINALRGHLTEFGLVAAKGPAGVQSLLAVVEEAQAFEAWPAAGRSALKALSDQLRHLGDEIARLEAALVAQHRSDARSRRLATIPGIGPITAGAIAATVPDATLFRCGRQFAAWLGLTPRANSSGGRERQTGITKQGDSYIRRLLVVGATAVIRALRRSRALSGWLARLLELKRAKIAAVALANKMARIAWAVMAREQNFRAAAV
jgi:transposase